MQRRALALEIVGGAQYISLSPVMHARLQGSLSHIGLHSYSRGDMTGLNDRLAKLLLVQLHGLSLQAGMAQRSGHGRRMTYS